MTSRLHAAFDALQGYALVCKADVEQEHAVSLLACFGHGAQGSMAGQRCFLIDRPVPALLSEDFVGVHARHGGGHPSRVPEIAAEQGGFACSVHAGEHHVERLLAHQKTPWRTSSDCLRWRKKSATAMRNAACSGSSIAAISAALGHAARWSLHAR